MPVVGIWRAQAEILKPPAPGEDINSWFLWALMACLILLVSVYLRRDDYLTRTWMPEILRKLEAKDQLLAKTIEDKDKLMAQTIESLETNCEARARHRSDVHAREMSTARREYLASLDGLMKAAFGDEDMKRVLRLRRGRMDEGGDPDPGTEART